MQMLEENWILETFLRNSGNNNSVMESNKLVKVDIFEINSYLILVYDLVEY